MFFPYFAGQLFGIIDLVVQYQSVSAFEQSNVQDDFSPYCQRIFDLRHAHFAMHFYGGVFLYSSDKRLSWILA